MDWSTFFSVFGLVFIAELGDKTQLAVVTQTCKYRRPWTVFLGASAALGAVTALGVLGGRALGRLIPEDLLRFLAALAFVVMALLIARDAAEEDSGLSQRACPDVCNDGGSASSDASLLPMWNWRVFAATFGLLFLAEMGDKTQLAVLSLSGKHGDAWAVFGGGAAALATVTAVAVAGGRFLCRVVPQRLLLWLSAAAFTVIGILIALGLF